MSTPLAEAVAEAGAWLTTLPDAQDYVDVTLLHDWGYPPLTLGSVRALYEVAKELCDTAAAYGTQDVERVIARRP